MADYDFFSPPRSPGTTPPPAGFAPPGAARGWTPAPTGLPVSAPGLGSSAKARQWIVILAVAVGALGTYGIGKSVLGRFKPLKKPATIAGLSADTSASEALTKGAQDKAVKFIVAYGTQPLSYVLIVRNDSAKTAAAVWDKEVSGLASFFGYSLGERAQPPGSDMLCAAMRTARRSGSVCSWGGARSDGVLVSYVDPDPVGLASIAFLARRAVNK